MASANRVIKRIANVLKKTGIDATLFVRNPVGDYNPNSQSRIGYTITPTLIKISLVYDHKETEDSRDYSKIVMQEEPGQDWNISINGLMYHIVEIEFYSFYGTNVAYECSLEKTVT